MLSSLKAAAKRVPVLGPVLKRAYLSLIVGEGRVRRIKEGWLKGAKYYHYRWSTPSADLVETNWADEMPGAFVKELAGKKRFYDVGANWGFYVLLAHKHRSPACEIVAFEPNPRTADELASQTRLNQIPAITIVQAAVSNSVGAIEFADTGSAIGQKLAAVNNSHKNAQTIVVPTLTLDAAAEKYGPPDLIKLDIEGAENLALAGAQNVFTKHRPTLMVEVHGEEKAAEFYDWMAKFNYRCTTPAGAWVTDRAYHHHLVCYPT